MRNVLLASLVAVSAMFAQSGCVPFGCGGFEGGGNTTYERASEMLLLCENGGYVATLDTAMLEGRYTMDGSAITGIRGDDDSYAFELVANGDGTAQAGRETALGDGMWTKVELSTVAADHANVLCNDLATRTWWTVSAAAKE